MYAQRLSAASLLDSDAQLPSADWEGAGKAPGLHLLSLGSELDVAVSIPKPLKGDRDRDIDIDVNMDKDSGMAVSLIEVL